MIRSPSKEYYYGYSKNIKRRIYAHCRDSVRGQHHNASLSNMLIKHGTKCRVDIVQTCDTAQQAVELEEQYINMFYDDPKNLNKSKAFPVKLPETQMGIKTLFKGEEVPKIVLFLRERVYGANLETALKFFKLGISSPDSLRNVIVNCTDRHNLSCDLRFYVLGRWFTSYESCQDYTGLSYKQINKIMNYEQD